MKATFKKYTFHFKRPSGTSRGVYTTRDSWFIFVGEGESTGIGECAPLPDLSIDNQKQMSVKLAQVCRQIGHFAQFPEELREWPSIGFGLEMALLDLKNGGRRQLFVSAFTRGEQGIPINGLIWMGTPEFMKQQIRAKLAAGFRCIKMKIGALDFETEFEILKSIRQEFSPAEITLRADANGAWSKETATENLNRLSELELHSVEQPIAAGRWDDMAEVSEKSPVPVALDEELIGITSHAEMQKLVEIIRPGYLILKPSLHGGFAGCERWIAEAEKAGAGWWVTSALESNVGLNALAQWTFQLNAKGEQGLGTGQLYTNNVDSPLEIDGEKLWFRPEKKWDLENLTKDEPENDFWQ